MTSNQPEYSCKPKKQNSSFGRKRTNCPKGEILKLFQYARVKKQAHVDLLLIQGL